MLSLRTTQWLSFQTIMVKSTTDAIVRITTLVHSPSVFPDGLPFRSFAVWSNFEIADLDLWRGEAYTKFFEFLDKKGGFYYEVRRSSQSEEVRDFTHR